jgi:surface protein
MSNWGKGVINNIGWGQGANNDIGWGSIYDKSNAGETLLKSDLNIDAFIIEIDTSKTGVSNSNQFQFTGAVGDYDVVAKQNGTQVATFNDLSGEQTITLPSSGVYDLEVKSKEVNGFNRIKFNNSGDKLKITDIKQWGTIVWSSFSSAFFGCSNMLATATDVPDLSQVNDMRFMFFNTSANPDTSNWDVSSVTTMSYMFYSAASANPDTSNWDVSNVTDMTYMFFGATSANPDTSNWDVSNVTDMNSMFRNASSANPDTSNWDVSNVTRMGGMFLNATSANPDTSNWDVSNVTNMNNMFLDSNLSEENLTACYENWSLLTLKNNVSFSAGTTKYNSSGQAGRDILVNTYNWTITDGGQI